MLQHFEVYKLHGIENNNVSIRFNSDLTLLVGKNGAGKTTILNILNILLSKQFESLFKYNFERMVLTTVEGILTISNNESDLNLQWNPTNKESNSSELKVQRKIYSIGYNGKQRMSFEYVGNLDEFAKSIETIYFPTYRRLETDIFNLLSNSINNNSEDISNYSRRTLDEVLNNLSNFSYETNNNIVLGVSNKEISSMIKKKWEEVIKFEKENLNSLVRNFMLSLLKTPSPKEVLPLEYLHKTFNAREVKEKLKQFFTMIGYIDKNNQLAVELINEYVLRVEKALGINSSDLEVSLNEETVDALVSHDLIHRLLEMFEESHKIITEQKKPFRELVKDLKEFIDADISFNEGEGVLSFSKNQNDLNSEDLSAGEKQLVTLFVYTKLCNREKTILLIDEPELSLHISWQRKFLKHIMNNNNNVQFIISSHSPFIVSNYKDKVEALAPMGVEE
ncbi:AAA family ATPase [Bacillus nitratireducens]|uniref:AAA family ATPase n=1 Tax=Bacillus nitratireducens TaxID=2026193 RepID=UPI00387A4B6B